MGLELKYYKLIGVNVHDSFPFSLMIYYLPDCPMVELVKKKKSKLLHHVSIPATNMNIPRSITFVYISVQDDYICLTIKQMPVL
jgi:hypothetical protein